MSLIIVFGLPGAGKTFVGKILAEHFQYHFHDGDKELPERLQDALRHQEDITDDMRHEFFHNIILRIKKLQQSHTHIALSQTFIKEKYREWILKEFPHAQFLLISADMKVRENRLKNRNDYPLDYLRKMVDNFDKPAIKYIEIVNNEEGEKKLIEQLKVILRTK